MNKDQWIVAGGLIALLLLEAVVHPSIKNWLMNAFNIFHNVNQTTTSSTGWFTPQSDATGGITSAGVGYSKITGVDQASCLAQGGIWFNGECRKFSGAGANK